MYWLEVSLTVDEETADLVSELLRPFAQDDTVVMEQMGDADNLDPDALEPEVIVKIYIPGDEDTEQLRRQIETAVSTAQQDFPAPTYKQLEDEDWANAWKENYKPFRIGERLWIQPSWLTPEEADPNDIMIVLDPGMAFGTGTHETTQLCLMALEKYMRAGDRVLDVGTGSGILAIAAAKLGASEVFAHDTDRQAVKAAVENGRMNQAASITVRQGTLAEAAPNKGQWDVVLVNILAPVIILILAQDDLMGYVGKNGRLILSGIILEQAAGVVEAVQAAGGRLVEQLTMGDWVALVVESNE